MNEFYILIDINITIDGEKFNEESRHDAIEALEEQMILVLLYLYYFFYQYINRLTIFASSVSTTLNEKLSIKSIKALSI